MSPALGLDSGTVRVVEYDESWPGLFLAEAQRIRETCGFPEIHLEHVGSTAVPGLCAKPILDILAGRPQSTPADAFIAAFVAAGYEHRGDAGIAGHEFFRRGQPRAFHIHLVEEEGTLWKQYIGFRDRLRADPEIRNRYAQLKRSLAARFPRDREAYINGKSGFVEQILRETELSG